MHRSALNVFKPNQTYFQAALTPIQESTHCLTLSCYYFIDIDECSERFHTCDGNANCTNTDGSFKCECEIGFSGDGHTCTGIYTTFSKRKLIFRLHQFRNELTPSCYYFIDIDECSGGSHTCDRNATCTNTDGSFKCQCEIGFSGDGHTCTGIYTTFSKNKSYFQAALTLIQESTHSIVLLFYRY